MKLSKQVEETVCDVCEKKEAHPWNACDGCGKDICYDCMETHFKVYPHSTYASGSGDGHYCHACDAKLRKECDPLHSAYLVIESLRSEEAGWYANFKTRRIAAEAHLKTLIK